MFFLVCVSALMVVSFSICLSVGVFGQFVLVFNSLRAILIIDYSSIK